MRIVCLSDTHGQHESISIPDGDIVVHAGDITRRGTLSEVKVFLDWYAHLPHKYKIFIAGNHDKCFEKEKEKVLPLIPSNVLYLEDSGAQIENFYIWGSPYTPKFLNWAFCKNRGKEILYHWQKIPLHTNILVTHGPPKSILDQTYRGHSVGCQDLMDMVILLPQLRLHIFGHIHEAQGVYQQNDCIFVNASILNQSYQQVNLPTVIDL